MTAQHLAFVVKYVEESKTPTEESDIKVDFIKDVQVPNGTAETIFQEAKKVIEEDLNLDSFAAVGSDGCSVMLGMKSGVATRLTEMKPDINSIHCQNHRLALAAKDSFKSIPEFQDVDDTMNFLFKYYDNSAVKSHSLRETTEVVR